MKLFSRLPKPKEGYFLVRVELDPIAKLYPRMICLGQNKEEAFRRLREYEAQGVACYIEDLEGNRLS